MKYVKALYNPMIRHFLVVRLLPEFGHLECLMTSSADTKRGDCPINDS